MCLKKCTHNKTLLCFKTYNALCALKHRLSYIKHSLSYIKHSLSNIKHSLSYINIVLVT